LFNGVIAKVNDQTRGSDRLRGLFAFCGERVEREKKNGGGCDSHPPKLFEEAEGGKPGAGMTCMHPYGAIA